MSCMGNILMHLVLGKPHVGSTDPFLTPHAKVSTRRSDARQSQGNYEDWKPLLKKTCCCLFIQQFLDMLVEIKIERVGSTIIQFPPSRRHRWAITCALLCSPYHQLSIGNRSEYLTCFLNIACDCEGSNMLYINLSCAWCFTFWLGLPMQTETTALASMLVPSWSPQWTKNMWKIMNSFYKAKCIWSWVMPELMYASQTWPVPEPNDPCGATPCCHNAWNCFFSMCFLWSCRGIYYPCESFNQWVIVISAFPSIRLWTCLAC